MRFECVWEKKLECTFSCVCSTLSCYDKLGTKDHLIEVLFFGHSAGVGAQLVVVVVVVLDLRMVVVEVSGTCYLLPGMRRNTYVPGMYACFSQDDPWYLVSSTLPSFANSVRL